MTGTAIVVGASMAGLVSAAVLADRFDRVIVLEKDTLNRDAQPRLGVPQGNHVHNLLSRGDATLGALFPGLFAALEGRDAQRVDWSRDVKWHHHGVWKKRIPSGVESWFMTRPMLEDCVREDLLTRGNVDIRDGVIVHRFVLDPAGGRVTGVELSQSEILECDLVVDCSGRRSVLYDGLKDHGFEKPGSQKIEVDVVYATCLMRPHQPQDCLAIAQIAPPPGKRSGVTFAVEGGNWVVTMFGYHGDHPPKDDLGWRRFAKSLDQPDIADLINASEQLTPIRKYHFRESVWNRYDRLTNAPERLIMLGDSVCSFNPIYGQGMTSATLQAEEMAAVLDTTGIATAHMLVPKRIARVVKECWQAVASEDFRFAETTGDGMPGAALINWYTRRVHRLASRHDHVEKAFLKVMHMEAGITSLFKPNILARALLRPV